MKCLLPFLLVFTFSCAAVAQTSAPTQTSGTTQATETTQTTTPPSAPSSQPEQRLFFPKGWYWGWGQFDLAPPHNEPDPNLCAENAGQYGGVNAKCNAFARYMLSGTVELRPIGRTVFRRVMLFFDPDFLFGKTVPQTLYTWSWDPIGMEFAYGAALTCPSALSSVSRRIPRSCVLARAIRIWDRPISDQTALGDSTTPSGCANTLEAGRRTRNRLQRRTIESLIEIQAA